MNQEEQKNDEINLFDYIDVILKRKKLILGLGLLFAAVVIGMNFLFSLRLPTFYKTHSIIEIGQGANLSCPDIIEKIIRGYYQEALKQKDINYFELTIEGTAPSNETMEAKIERAKKTSCQGNIIYLKVKSGQPQEAEKFLNEIHNIIIEEFQKTFTVEKKFREEKLNILKNRIFFTDNERKELENKIATLEPKAYQDPTAFQLALLDTQLKVEEKKQEIISLREQILQSEKETKYISMKPTKIIKEPTSSEEINKSQIFNNMAIMSGIFGLFIGILLAFGQESYKRNKRLV